MRKGFAISLGVAGLVANAASAKFASFRPEQNFLSQEKP